jgi:hypothetical protein
VSSSQNAAAKRGETVEKIPWEKRFHFGDGTSAKNLSELKTKIETISYDEFYHHVNPEKNDFANWVEHVIEDKELADKLRAVSSIVETVEFLNEAISPFEAEGGEEEDLQTHIEEQLFSELPPAVEEEVPEIHVEPAVIEQPEAEEPSLPTSEELEFAGRVPGAPVTTKEPAHTSIKELSERHAARHKEEQMRFFVRQFFYGFVFGIVVGLILGRVISLLS